MYLPRKDERLSRPGWLTYSGRFTHLSGHPSAAGWAQDSESSPVRDRRSTTEPWNQPHYVSDLWQLVNNNNNHSTALYLGQPQWPVTRTLRNINPIYHLLVLKFLTSTPMPPSLPLGLIPRRTWRKQLKHKEPEDKQPHFLDTCLILDMMRSLVNHWSPLTHTSHYMTTSRPHRREPK